MAKKKKKQNYQGIVYSTDPGYDYDEGYAEDEETLPPRQQNLKISLRRHKGNKQATIEWNYVGREDDLKDLGKMLKQKCGTGGAVKDGEIIFQGDKRKQVAAVLEKEGYKYKFAGG